MKSWTVDQLKAALQDIPGDLPVDLRIHHAGHVVDTIRIASVLSDSTAVQIGAYGSDWKPDPVELAKMQAWLDNPAPIGDSGE